MANKKYPDELRARAVRLYRDADPKPVIKRLGEQLGVHPRRCVTGFGRTRPTTASVPACPPPRWSTRTVGYVRNTPTSNGSTRS